MVNLPTIDAARRQTEAELWREFGAAQPRIFGALLDAVALALRRFATVRLERLPRLADFAQWATAAEPALGVEPGQFLAKFRSSGEQANEVALEASPIAALLRDLSAGDGWEGTATDLLAELDRLADDRTRRQKSWPTSARALSGALKRLTPNLRAVGVEISDRREGHARRRVWCVQATRIGPGSCVRTTFCVREPGDEGELADGADGADAKKHPHSGPGPAHNSPWAGTEPSEHDGAERDWALANAELAAAVEPTRGGFEP